MSGLIPFNKKNSLLDTDYGDLNNMVDDFFSGNWPIRRNFERDTFKLDVQEKENEYFIEAELPGVKKDEIDLELNEGRLTISIKREEKIDEEKKNYIHKERRYRSMSRSVYLADANSEGVKASLDNGVLSITVSRQAKSQNVHKIDIE